MSVRVDWYIVNPLNAELNPIRHLLALVGARHIVHVSRMKVNDVTKIVAPQSSGSTVQVLDSNNSDVATKRLFKEHACHTKKKRRKKTQCNTDLSFVMRKQWSNQY